jgi:hypothetical protein
MSSLARLCAGGLAVVLLMNYGTLPSATGLDPSQQSVHSPPPKLLHVVDRTHKGDRIAPAQDSSQSNVKPAPIEQTRPQPPRIPVGCDPAFSPLSGSSRANNFTARCLAGNEFFPGAVATPA